ncbi:hypothetical protein V6N12_029041 [Hibiscus sabdariffa]|uniref:Uncharacterized protein n=1 Tax=Hibiscus sabdariffa TaxID=183260 RepID=A0ABR2F7K0_9ROSI
MMKLLQEANEDNLDKRRRTDEFLTQLRGKEEDEFFDDVSAMRQATRERIQRIQMGTTKVKSGGDRQDGGGLSSTYDDDRESGDRCEIRSSRRHGEEYWIGFASGNFHHMSEFGGNMSATPSGSRERSEPRARSKEKGNGTKMHTSEGSSSRRRSTSTNPGYIDSSTSTHGFYPPGPGQSSYFQPPHGYYPPFPNYSMPMPYQPQMYPPPPMYQPPPPHMYPPQIYPPPQLFENQGENVTLFGYIFGQGPQNQRSSQDPSQGEGEGEGEGGSEGYDHPCYSTNW